ncbi:callose synthase 1 [Striga asiatica]|uniref:Callose synthase 1 n=1 Tax=Striga asiatica TaxID=4170 RepID=A0A5A7RCX2_STRAF|nr:callose synthase 1 [Striga asiatica]
MKKEKWSKEDEPCVVTTFRIVTNIVKQTSEVNKYGSRGGGRNEMGLHLLRRGNHPLSRRDFSARKFELRWHVEAEAVYLCQWLSLPTNKVWSTVSNYKTTE